MKDSIMGNLNESGSNGDTQNAPAGFMESNSLIAKTGFILLVVIIHFNDDECRDVFIEWSIPRI